MSASLSFSVYMFLIPSVWVFFSISVSLILTVSHSLSLCFSGSLSLSYTDIHTPLCLLTPGIVSRTRMFHQHMEINRRGMMPAP